MKFKKISVLPIIIAMVLVLSITAGAIIGVNFLQNTEETKPPLRIGDLDLNGECNIVDLVILKKFEAGVSEIDAVQQKQADYNEDTFIDGLDLAELRCALLGGVSYGDNTVSFNEFTDASVYYISANGTSQLGTNVNDPMSLETANSKLYSKGDKILLKSGDTFYGTLNFKIDPEDTAEEGKLTISRYSNGEMPVISGAAVVTNKASFVTVTNNYMYSLDLSNRSLFSEGYLSGDGILNIGFITDGTNIYGNRKETKEELTKNYDFCILGNIMYVKCDRNPVDALGTVKLATNNALACVNSDIAISGLCFKHTGSHAIKGGDGTVISNVTINNNVIEYVGGSLLYTTDSEFVRYGNGIEFYNKTVSNITVTNNIIRQCYDVGFTVQGNKSECSASNINISNNVFYANKQSNEIFIESTKSAGIKNYRFIGNLCIGSGSTWGNFTSNPKNGVPCEFLFYNYYPSELDMTISNNTIVDCTRLYWWTGDNTDIFKNGIKSFENRLFVKSSVFSFKDSLSLSELQSKYLKEIDSVYTEISSESDYAELKQSAHGDDINVIFDIAESLGK